MRRSLGCLQILLFLGAPWIAAQQQPWVRSYDTEPFEKMISVVPLGSAGALLSLDASRKLFTVDASGAPRAAVSLGGDLHFTASNPAGEIFAGGDEESSFAVSKFRADLTLLWMNSYATPQHRFTGGSAGTRDGGLLLATYLRDGVGVIRLAGDGTIVWRKSMNASGREMLQSIRETSDGGCVAAGHRDGHAWLVKLDSKGRVQWQKTFAYAHGEFYSVLETRSRDIVVVGDLNGDLAVMDLTASGALRWQKLYSSGEVQGFSVVETHDGGFVVAGARRSFASLFLVRLGSDGTPGWKRSVAAPESNGVNVLKESIIAAVGPSIFLSLPERKNDKRALVVEIDAATGTSSCGWLVEGGGEWADGTFAGEELPLDVGELTVEAKPQRPLLYAIPMTSALETCGSPITSTPSAAVLPWDGLNRNKVLTAHYVSLMREKKFDELDVEAARLRRDRPFDNPFWWHIDTFYEALISVPGTSEDQRIAAFREWVTQRPDSPTAKLALAKALSRAASMRRGTGTSETVTEEGWSETTRLQREAQRILNDAGEAAETDSQYWILRISLDFKLDDADVLEMVRRAAKKVQTPRLFMAAAEYLLPKYGGSSAGFLAFLNEATSLTKQTFGEGMYAILVPIARTDSSQVYVTEIEPKIDWNRVRKGYRDLISTAPEWIPTYHSTAMMARFLNDRAFAREIFTKPQSGWYDDATGLWGTRAYYDAVREWALSKPIEPFMDLEASKWPSIVLQTQLALSNGVHNRIGAFLIETPSGIAAVSVAPAIERRADDVSAVREARQNLLKWVAWPPDHSNRRVEVSIAAVPSVNSARSTLLAIPAQKTELVHVLKPASTEWVPGEKKLASRRRFIVGCTWTGDVCKQTVIEAEDQGGPGDESGRTYVRDLGIRQTISPDSFVGGAVLDENGLVRAVVTGESTSVRPGVPTILQADDLSMLIATSKTELSAAKPTETGAAPVPTQKSPSTTSFAELPFAKWPQIVMQNKVVLTSGTYTEIGSFLVETPTGVVGVTVVPEKRTFQRSDNPIRSTWTKLTKWTMWSPAEPKRVMSVAGLETKDHEEWQRGVAVSIVPFNGRLPVKALQARNLLSSELSGRCLVVGCRWSNGRCSQTVVEASLAGGELDMSRAVRTLFIGLPNQTDAFTGAAVLDMNGYALAVVTGEADAHSPQFPYMLGAESLRLVLPPTASPASPRSSPGTNGGS